MGTRREILKDLLAFYDARGPDNFVVADRLVPPKSESDRAEHEAALNSLLREGMILGMEGQGGVVGFSINPARASEVRRELNPELPRPNPWVSGSFYLAVTVVLLTLLLVISTTVPWWAFPVVVLGGLIGVIVVGAFQLRHDRSLTDEGFLSLMLATLRQLPLLRIAMRKPEAGPETAKE